MPSPSPSLSPADARILVVEDDEAMSRAVTSGLRARGYDVVLAPTGRRALDDANALVPDVVLLDLGLPDIDGLDVCRQLRRWTQNPIIVVSADGSEQRKIAALDEGADDYVTKPFSMPELHARVRAALRHRATLAALLEGPVIEIGTLRLDVVGYVATVKGVPLDLTRREFEMLKLLARNLGKALSYNRLLEEADGDPSLAPSVVRNHVHHLRRKLGDGHGAPRILTEPRIGYRMVSPEGEFSRP